MTTPENHLTFVSNKGNSFWRWKGIFICYHPYGYSPKQLEPLLLEAVIETEAAGHNVYVKPGCQIMQGAWGKRVAALPR